MHLSFKLSMPRNNAWNGKRCDYSNGNYLIFKKTIAEPTVEELNNLHFLTATGTMTKQGPRAAYEAIRLKYYEALDASTPPHKKCPKCGVWHKRRYECPFCHCKIEEEK